MQDRPAYNPSVLYAWSFCNSQTTPDRPVNSEKYQNPLYTEPPSYNNLCYMQDSNLTNPKPNPNINP